MVILDLFCGSGGGAKGYAQAGFQPIGVDHVYQEYYPYPHYRRDFRNITDLIERLRPVAIHASPPCQFYSRGTHKDYPDLVPATQDLLNNIGLPYIIENVPDAPLAKEKTIELCGTQFEELRVIRHRLFETNWGCQPKGFCVPIYDHPLVYTNKKYRNHYGKVDPNTGYVQVTGNGNTTREQAARAMGIDWYMTKWDLNQCIPPAYTEFIGQQLMAYLLGEPAPVPDTITPWQMQTDTTAILMRKF